MAAKANTFRRHFGTALITALVAALATTGLVTAPASAVALPAPSGLSPTSGVFATNPVLKWNHVAGATSYRVELSTSDTFSSLIAGAGVSATVNTQFVPPTQLPAGTVYWRVAANGSDPINWSVGSFSRAAIGVPQLLTPVNGGVVHAPTEPEAYTWVPVAGAISYNLQIGDDDSFTDPLRYKSYTTQRASYTFKTLPAAGTRFWRVQAVLSTTVKSEWSNTQSVEIGLFDLGVPQQPTLPANDANAPVDDIVLDWEPIGGAATYELEIALDDQFLNKVHTKTLIAGSRYSPPGVLHNDQYWWRIRPVDAAGHAAAWSAMPVWAFQRHWADQAQLQWPENNATVTDADRVFFQWSGVHLATSYRLDLSTSPDFTVASTRSCTTVNTTLTPNWNSSVVAPCRPIVGTTYYWRVVASDSPASGSATPQTNPHAADAEVRSFTFMPTVVSQVAPADGATVELPVLRWQAVSAALRYRVQVWDGNGAVKLSTFTYGTSLTPRTVLPAGQTYRWQVEAFAASGAQISNPLLPLFQPTFTVLTPMSATGAAPDALSSPMEPTPRVPTMRWTPVENATKYTLRIKRQENPTWTTEILNLGYPAGETWDLTNLAAGTYDFHVEAYNGTASLGIGQPGQFTVAAPRTVVGHQAALVGTDLDSTDTARSCDAELPSTCQNLRQTPVLAWDADPDAAVYLLIRSSDPVLTDSIDTKTFVYGTSWTDTATLADANASTGTYWAVISCLAPNVCPISGPAKHAFNKQAPTVKPTAPANGSTHAYEVTLSWQDWLADPGPGNGDTPLTATAPTAEARYYQLQTSTSATFTTLLDSINVDQTTYTSFTKVYPDGPIYWRVRAYDGSNRPTAWSPTRSFQVVSAAPATTTPAANATFSAGSAFTWQPRALASSYEVKVLRNDGSTIETAPAGSIALSVTAIQQTSYAPTASLAVLPLDANGNNYRWFLRRKSVSGGVGPWSPAVPFRVVPKVPAQVAPAAGAVVSPRGAVFSWSTLDGAATYRFEHRAVGGSTAFVTTTALRYAPTTVLPAGAREWRVNGYDASGNLLGSSAWRSYSVSGITGSVSISGQSRVGGTLTAAVSWQPAGVTTRLQWYRATTLITGATSATYTVKSEDVGKAITVRATGTKTGYDPVVKISNAITGAAALAVQNTARPTISGTAKIGYTLTASRGSWSPTPTSFAFQWFRSGVAIAGATGATYRVTAADPGRNLQVRVTAHKAGYKSGASTSVAKFVPRVATKTSAWFVDATITSTTSPQLRVVVSAPGLANPTGEVRVYEGATLLRTVKLGASSAGRATITLPRRSVGSHYLYAKYMGSSYAIASTSPKVLLSVRR